MLENNDETTLLEAEQRVGHYRHYLKAGLKLNIQKMKIRASGPITSWQIDGETTEMVTDFVFFSSKITADMVIADMKLKDACSLEEKL